MGQRLRILAAVALVCALVAGCATPLLYSYAQKDCAQRTQAETVQRQHFEAIRKACLKAPPASLFNSKLLFVVPSYGFVRENIAIESGRVPANSDVLDYVVNANIREMRLDADLITTSGLFRETVTTQAPQGNGEDDPPANPDGYSIHCVTTLRSGVNVWGYAVRGPGIVKPMFISSLDIRHAAVNGWDSLSQIIRSGR